MPVIIKDYTWRQTDTLVIVRVPLKDIALNKVDLFTSESYIKVHFPPFLFEACLSNNIDEESSRCTLCNGEAVFELTKCENVSWEKLVKDISKAEMLEIKQKAIESSQIKAAAAAKANSEKRTERGRLAVRQQIALDSQLKDVIDKRRDTEKTAAMKDFFEWKQRHSSVRITELPDDKPVVGGCGDIFHDEDICQAEPVAQIEPVALIGPVTRSKPICSTIGSAEPVPLPRQSGTIQVAFTQRAFPTPTRESKQQEEQEWLAKQAEARRQTGFMVEDLTADELDPHWLKEKGDSFCKVGNYLGAISAYSHGIKLSNKMASLYCNRAAAHFAIGNLRRVVQDTTSALELLTPAVDQNAAARQHCHSRRGAALCRLNLPQPGLADLETAARLCAGGVPTRELHNMIQDARRQLERGEPTLLDELPMSGVLTTADLD